MPRLVLIFLLSGLAVSPAFAQLKLGQATLDSLLAQLPKTKPDTNRVNLLYRISFTYIRIEPNTGISYANQCLALAQQLKWKKGIVNAYNALGTNYRAFL